MLHGVSVN